MVNHLGIEGSEIETTITTIVDNFYWMLLCAGPGMISFYHLSNSMMWVLVLFQFYR